MSICSDCCGLSDDQITSFPSSLGLSSVYPSCSFGCSGPGLIGNALSKFLASPLLCPLPREPTLYSMPTLNSGPCSGITFSERHPLLTFSFLVYFLAHRAVYSKYYAKCLLLTWLLRYCSAPCPSALGRSQNSLFIVPSTLELFMIHFHISHVSLQP